MFLARAVVERLGGEVTIRPAPGTGTSVVFALPLEAPRLAGGGGAMTASPMLLVDDDEVFRERLARALRERG